MSAEKDREPALAQASVPAGAVFLSYASEDAAAADRIATVLRSAGVEVWFDKSALRGGDAWDRQIREQIHNCRLFIPVISANSERRDEGYFRREWSLAADRTRDMAHKRAFLVPVVIDGTAERGASVPEKFHELQWTRLPGGQTPPAFVERVRKLLSPAEPETGAKARPQTAPVFPAVPATGGLSSPPRRRGVVLAIAVVAAVGLTYILVDKLWLSKRTATTASKAAPSATAPEESIAVLPFVDLSEKHDQEYFADGMAEEIINLLVTIPDLKVIGRTSSFQFKGKTDDLRAIGSALGTAYVVEGSVRRSGDHIRVTAQLIDTRDGTHRWSQAYDREVVDVLKVQDEIAAALVRALQLEVTSFNPLQARVSPKNSEVYDSYLRGLHTSDRFDQLGFEEAVANFRRALELDPSFVPAAEALAVTCANIADWHFVSPAAGWEQARVAGEAALKLDAKSPLAHAVLGAVHTDYDWDWKAAGVELSTAVSLAPNNPTVLIYAAEGQLAVGRWDDALHLLDTAIAADPLYPHAYGDASEVYVRLGRLTEAERAVRHALEISPTHVWGHYWLGVVLLTRGDRQEALAEMNKETSSALKIAGQAVVYQALRQTTDAAAALARLEAEHAGDRAMFIAEAYAYRGSKDQALAWLERAYTQKDASLYYIKGDPLLRSLESDPGYKAFLRKMNLPE